MADAQTVSQLNQALQNKGGMMSTDQSKAEFRDPTALKRAPRAAVDGAAGMILAYADVAGTPEQVFRALTTDEVENGGNFRESITRRTLRLTSLFAEGGVSPWLWKAARR